jgi:hypothetical protein
VAVIEVKRLDVNGPSLAVNIMEGQSAKIANTVPIYSE